MFARWWCIYDCNSKIWRHSCWPLHANRDKSLKTHYWYKTSCWRIFWFILWIDTIDKSKLFKSLLGCHCFTGCDSISVFYGKRKIKALSVFCKGKSFIQAFYNLGQTNELPEETIQAFVCHLYGTSSASENQADIDQLQYTIYCLKRFKVETLPPCQNVLKQHMKRSNYQTYIWRK